MTIERLRIGPAGIGTAESPQTTFRRHAVAPSQPGGVGAQRRLHPFEKHPIVRPTACRTAERQDGTHPFRIGHCPEQRLHAAHGPAADQGELPVVAIQPIEQRLLRPHVVQQADPREVRCALTGRSVARRSRPACAEQVGQHHAVIAACQRAIRTKQAGCPNVCRRSSLESAPGCPARGSACPLPDSTAAHCAGVRRFRGAFRPAQKFFSLFISIICVTPAVAHRAPGGTSVGPFLYTLACILDEGIVPAARPPFMTPRSASR